MNQETRLKIIEENPELTKDIKILSFVLLPIELWCLQAIIKFSKPMTTREFFSTSLISLGNFLFLKTVPFGIKNIFQNPSEGLNLADKFTILSQDKQEYKKLSERFVNSLEKSETEQSKELMKIFSQIKIKYPSYDLFKSSLNNLQYLGILVKRKRGSESKQEYWVVNPPFFENFKDKFLEIFELNNSILDLKPYEDLLKEVTS